jgi:hypothetical protein
MAAEEEVSAKHTAQQVEGGSLDFSNDRRIGQALANVKPFGFAAIGKQAVVPDFHKAARQDVHEEAPDKFKGRDGHGFPTVAIFVVAPLKSDLAILKIQDAAV